MIPITILLADDQRLIRESWFLVLSNEPYFHVVGNAGSGGEAIALAGKLRPSVVLININMYPMNGFDATRSIRKLSPESRIIGISVDPFPAYAKKLFELGAAGYITKNSSMQELINAIYKVSAGEKYLCEEVKEIMIKQGYKKSLENTEFNFLSKREIEIAERIKKGSSSRAIGEELGISLKTVEVHRYNMLKKLKLKNTAALVNYLNQNVL